MIRKISAHYVFPVCGPPLKFGIVTCAANGELLEVIDNKGVFKETASVEFYSGILVPCFVKEDFETDKIVIEMMIGLMEKYPDLEFEEVIKMFTLDRAQKQKKDHLFGSFEKHKIPGINVISNLDFKNMRLTKHSSVSTLVSQII